jgi:nucleotide-binding universal stress UspA family protein
VKKILVAIDDIESNTVNSPMMMRVIEQARAFSSKVWLLHVVSRVRPVPFNVDGKVLRREAATELHHEHEFLQHLAQCLRDREVDAKSLLIEGATIGSIMEEADRLDVDLIILGCHKHSLLYGALMDTTEEGLLSKCMHPLMFIPAA